MIALGTAARTLIAAALLGALLPVGISKFYTGTDPKLAATLNPLNLDAQIESIIRTSSNGQTSGTTIRAMLLRTPETAGLLTWLSRIAPTDARVISLRGAVKEASGDPDGAKSLYREAFAQLPTEELSLRRLLAFGFEVPAADPDTLLYLDLLLRRHWHYREALVPFLKVATSVPELRAQLEDRFNLLPPWRDWAISVLANDVSTLDFAYGLIERDIEQAKASEEVARAMPVIVQALVKNERYVDAYSLFNAYRQSRDGERPGYVNNSQFLPEARPTLFDWSAARVAGTFLTFPEGTGGGGLAVKFTDAPALGTIIRQQILLPPGEYRLETRLESKELVAPKGLAWTVQCADGHGAARLEIPPGTFAGTLAQEFAVPVGCVPQSLSLATGAQTAQRKNAYRGQVTFDFVRIGRVTRN